MDRKVKIVATIGPTSQDEAIIKRLILTGMNVARLNFSHGTHKEHSTQNLVLRHVSEQLSRPLAILQDLQGPKVRVGVLKQPIMLEGGQEVLLYPEESKLQPTSNHLQCIPVDFPELFTSVEPGNPILLDDGRIALSVLEADRRKITAQIITGGVLNSQKGINLPGIRLDIPNFTEKDATDLEFGLSLSVDGVAISFVRTVQDVLTVRQVIDKFAPLNPPLIISKLERPEALENLDEIMAVSDGVMVARGDLGVEMAPEMVPGAQKRIIQAANRMGKLVITATQMLESMINNPLPTRAEASDVANAVFDGTDAVMLSGETAVGEYPVECVAMMDRIVMQAEVDFEKWGRDQVIETSGAHHDDAVALSLAARELAHDRDVAAIAVFTRTGRTAILMSKARPCVPILAFTPDENTYRRLAFVWGVESHIVPFADKLEDMIGHVENALKVSGLVKSGQQVVLVAGYPLKEIHPPNMALLHTVR